MNHAADQREPRHEREGGGALPDVLAHDEPLRSMPGWADAEHADAADNGYKQPRYRRGRSDVGQPVLARRRGQGEPMEEELALSTIAAELSQGNQSPRVDLARFQAIRKTGLLHVVLHGTAAVFPHTELHRKGNPNWVKGVKGK